MQGGRRAGVAVRAQVHAPDVDALLGLDDQVVGRDAGWQVAAVLQVVSAGSGAQQPLEPAPRGQVRIDVHRGLVGQQVLVDVGVEGDDEQVVVQRDVEQLEVVGEVVLVLVQHAQRQGPVPGALALHGPVRRVLRRHRLRAAPFGEQPHDRQLDQPQRLVRTAQQPAEVGIGARIGQRVEHAAQQPEEPGGEQFARLVRGEHGQPHPGCVPYVHRRGRGAGDPRDRDPHRRAAHVELQGVPAQLVGQQTGPALAPVQHPQAHVDLGDAAGDAMVGHGEAFGEPAHVPQPQRRVQERQPDRGPVLVEPRRGAGHRDAHDRLGEPAPSVHLFRFPHDPASSFRRDIMSCRCVIRLAPCGWRAGGTRFDTRRMFDRRGRGVVQFPGRQWRKSVRFRRGPATVTGECAPSVLTTARAGRSGRTRGSGSQETCCRR